MKPQSLLLRRLAVGALAVILLAGLVFVFMRSGPLAPTRVTVVQAGEGMLSPALFGIGTVEARRNYLVGPTVAGRVRSVAVDVGDAVKTGALLAEMDPVDLDERAAALDASMARARSAVVAMEALRRDAVAKQSIAVANARRYGELGAQDFISAGAVEAKQQEKASAEAGVSAAEANLSAARQDLLRLAAERAGLTQQRANVRLLAPSDGVVVSRDAEPGSTVVAGQAVVRVIEPRSMWVKVRLDQGRSGGLAVGQVARIVLRSNADRSVAGKVVRVEAISDSVTEERIALVGFDEVPVGLSVGELAEVTLAGVPTAKTVLVPNASIQRQQGQTGVWRLTEDGLDFAPVRLGQASLDGQVQVLDGIRPGETVVVHSEQALVAGRRIQVVDSLTGRRP